MSSGFSYTGGRPRCFVYWQEFQKCYIQAELPIECQTKGADYLNCLHFPGKQRQNAAVVKQEMHEHGHGHVKESA